MTHHHSSSSPPTSCTRVPVGFRFHPTDEELVGYYLPKKVAAKHIDLELIKELDLYKVEPWDLQDVCKIGADTITEKQTDYYFFSRKDKKYPTGNRANRATTAGFWKATGRDKAIYVAKDVQQLIGMRKTLVFYEGRAPHGNKTDWIMHEFRLDDGPAMPAHDDGGWVVCRVFKKSKNFKMKSTEERAVSFEGSSQFGLSMPLENSNIMGRESPEILSEAAAHHGSASCCYPAALVPCKQELITQLMDNSCSSYDDPFNNAPPLHQMAHQLGMHNKLQQSNNNGSSLDDWAGVYHESTGVRSTGAAAAADSFRSPAAATTTARAAAADQSLMGGAGDIHILLQLKRQNSDLFPSSCEFDLWNFNQMSYQSKAPGSFFFLPL
ncbi:unnamed protein product [Sphagnum jensenii]|uniref:NAC domain-containing protein n=1 Tax=Sphagnum jensenii TaxID=128206 RepID=A0ABP1ABU9_9BRYO